MKKITLSALLLVSAIMNAQTTLGIITERAVTATQAITFTNNNQFPVTDVTTDVFEGTAAVKFSPSGLATDNSWAMGSIKPATTIDISSYNTYSITLKSTSQEEIRLRLQSAGQNAYLTLTAAGEYGFTRDGNWHTLNIPLTTFTGLNANLNLTAITDLLVLRSNNVNVSLAANYDFYIDDFYLTDALLGTQSFNANKVSMYPNPASSEVSFSALNSIDSIVIHNLLGQKVLETSPKNTNANVNISSLASGAYVVTLKTEGKTLESKLLKK